MPDAKFGRKKINNETASNRFGSNDSTILSRTQRNGRNQYAIIIVFISKATELADCAKKKKYTLCIKKTCPLFSLPFYILNNLAKNEPILISFRIHDPEEISH